MATVSALLALCAGCESVLGLDDLDFRDAVGGATASGSGGGATGGAGGPGGSGGGGAAGDGAGGSSPEVAGCADGTREAYEDALVHPAIAACAGAFLVPGVVTAASYLPACARSAGNDGRNPSGDGCTVEDLCADGWHVCTDAADVAASSSDGACPPPPVPFKPAFWLTRQSQDSTTCAPYPAKNNLVGCGETWCIELQQPVPAECEPLTCVVDHHHCEATSQWVCSDLGSYGEAAVVAKVGADEGGVLCCRDPR